MMIHEFLYGTRDPEKESTVIPDLMRFSERLLELESKDAGFWISLLKRFLLDQPRAFVIGKPSTSLGDEMAKDEEKRIQEQVSSLPFPSLPFPSLLFPPLCFARRLTLA